MCKSESLRSYDSRSRRSGESRWSRSWQADSLKAHRKCGAISSWRYSERIPANAAFHKCLNCTEAREKLRNLVKQQKSVLPKKYCLLCNAIRCVCWLITTLLVAGRSIISTRFSLPLSCGNSFGVQICGWDCNSRAFSNRA